jgi:hypothetical protein
MTGAAEETVSVVGSGDGLVRTGDVVSGGEGVS